MSSPQIGMIEDNGKNVDIEYTSHSASEQERRLIDQVPKGGTGYIRAWA